MLNGEGATGVKVAREGTCRKVEVLRVRIEVGIELVLVDAVDCAAETTTGGAGGAMGEAGTLLV